MSQINNNIVRDGSTLTPLTFRDDPDCLMSLRTLAAHADVSERTLFRWIHDRRHPLPACRLKRQWRVRRGDFERWLQEERDRPAAPPATVSGKGLSAATRAGYEMAGYVVTDH